MYRRFAELSSELKIKPGRTHMIVSPLRKALLTLIWKATADAELALGEAKTQSVAASEMAVDAALGVLPVASAHEGSFTTILPLAARSLEHWNDSAMALAVPAMGVPIISDVPENAASAMAEDVLMAAAEGLVAPATMPPMARDSRFELRVE